ncbi:GNAT family N-acetyltransferase [Methanolobus sp. ZRKC3]|uniref:GNAT family N-acetyltransferase n=1 Tax=Methanolobus sp. ZRKC3 TaxID=3125786 RepID=UPI0032499384
MIVLRPFAEEDNAALLEIEKLCPQGNDKIAEAMDKSPDITARYRLYDNWEIFVAEEENRVAGWIGWTVKQNADGKKYAYLAEVIIHPDFRRRGIATELMNKAETELKRKGVSYTYCYVFEANDASNAMVVKNGYQRVGEVQVQAIPVYKERKLAPQFSIRPAGRDDIQDIVDLINGYYAGRTHFSAYTAESFEAHVKNIPGYDMDNLWVAFSGDSIVACAGLWDIAPIARMYYAKEPATMRILGVVFNFLDHFTSMPMIPAENEPFATQYITDHAFTPEGTQAMSNLIRYLNNIVLECQGNFIVGIHSPDDPMVQVMKGLRTMVEKWNVFTKLLDNGTISLEPLYLDIRDFSA